MLACGTVAGACSSAHSPQDYPKTGLAEGVVTLEPAPSPGRFLYRPRASDLRDAAERRVGSLRFLLGNSGERWLIGGDGEYRAAPQLAPEMLVEVGQVPGPLPFWFLGKSGRVYRSAQPLGELPPDAIAQPPEPLVRVSAGANVLLGVTRAGVLIRSSNLGLTWDRMDVSDRVADVAFTSGADALVLTSPEAYFGLSHEASKVTRLDVGPFGGLRLERTATGLRVLGVLGARTWVTDHFEVSAQQPADENRGKEPLDSPKLERFGSADAITRGVAVLDQRFYFEVESAGSELVLWRGRATQPLERLSLNIAACREPRLSGGRDLLYLVCGALPGKITPLRIYASQDEGRSFEQEPYKVRGDGNVLTLAPWRRRLVLSGICDPEGEPSGCVPGGVYWAERKEETTKLRELRLLGLSGVALALSVSPGSGRLLVFGATNKGEELSLYAGLEPEAPFEVEPLPGVRPPRASGTLVIEPPAWGEDGYVAATALDTRSGSSQLIVADEQGHVLQVAAAPANAAHVSGAGMRALALVPRTGDAWESLNGGESWQAIGKVPSTLCSSSRQQTCQVNVACFTHGCLVADHLTRLGWGGQAEQLEPPPGSEAEKPRVQPQAPIVCRIAEEALWRSVPGGQIPEATAASLGDVDWFTHHVDWSTAAVTAYEMDYAPAERGSLRAEEVFERREDAAQWVLFSSPQTEGVAALRGKLNGAGMEVAWRNLFRAPKTHRWPVRSQTGTTSDVWTHSPTRDLARVGVPGLVSIAGDGVFVRPGADETKAQTWLVREGGETRTLPPFVWPAVAASGRTEMSQVDGRPLGLKLFRNGAALVRATLQGASWELSAQSVGVDEPGRFDLHQSYDLTYFRGQPHYHLWQLGPENSTAVTYPLQAQGDVFGEGVSVATQGALGPSDEPRVCTSKERTSLRVIAPAEAKSLHPVLVRHNSEPTRLFLTRNAVLYGPAASPCVAAYEGESVTRSKSEEVRVITRPDRNQPSWMFRRAAGDSAFEYRPMSCEFDPKEPIPEEVRALLPEDDQ